MEREGERGPDMVTAGTMARGVALTGHSLFVGDVGVGSFSKEEINGVLLLGTRR